ncbi:MAG TPA: serine--tRNA ligase [Patescibacteria group bacterium]|nr:serine--tRNA ligase [Patescibacteria group bacterium]
MLDIKFIRENLDAVKTNIQNRGIKNADPEKVLKLYSDRVAILQEVESLRAERNVSSQKMKSKLEPEERNGLILRGKEIKESLATLEAQIEMLDAEFNTAFKNIPNMTHPDVPVGMEGEFTLLKTVGDPPKFDFEPKDHVTLGQELDLLDFENAAQVSGQKFYYLKNEGALLELALINYAMAKLLKRGFTPYLTPDLARINILEAIGFNPRGEETQVYSVADSDLCLVGTAEITLGGFLKDKILQKKELPVKMGGFSHCFRTESGAYGKESRGLYRVHQFSKVEMFAFTAPEDSERVHEEMRDIEIEIFKDLGLCFRVIDIPTGDLGAPAYRKYDLEAWMPSRGDFGEVTSTSNCTEFQSRRLNIRYRDDENNLQFVHTLNGTAVAVPRAIIAILENYQQADGSVLVPEVLKPYMAGVERITREKAWSR